MFGFGEIKAFKFVIVNLWEFYKYGRYYMAQSANGILTLLEFSCLILFLFNKASEFLIVIHNQVGVRNIELCSGSCI